MINQAIKNGRKIWDSKVVELPLLEQITGGVRRYPEVAFIFFEFFLPGVVGKKKFKNRVEFEHVSKIATVTDEAFAILLLENSWEKWGDELEKNTKDPTKLIPTKWTSTKNTGKRYCGWKTDGMEHFNKLHKMVVKDRKMDQRKPLDQQVEYSYYKKKIDDIDEEGEDSTTRGGTTSERMNMNVEYDKWSDEED